MQEFGQEEVHSLEATGFSGGVWLLWNEENVRLELEYHDKAFLHFLVKSCDGLEWVLIAVYAHPNPSIRRYLWGKLCEVEVSKP